MKNLSCLALSLALLIGLFCCGTASAKDEWIQVRSKNFFLVGNASEKDIRKVDTRLEEFRETLRQLFQKISFVSSVPTNVVVFKSDSAYKPFKPKRADGKTDNFLAGYFQPGEDVNYITLSTERDDIETFSVIFHEYVHSIVNTNYGKSNVPAWFNEGLAEYYSTFAIEDDQKVKLGLPLGRHVKLLQGSKLIPLDTLFNISNRQLPETGDHSRSIFYAESWALIHYLIFNEKSDALYRFLNALLKGEPAETSFKDAFQISYADLEKALQKYVGQSSFMYREFTFKEKLNFDSGTKVAPLTESESNTYLGDLLYHSDRADEAEPYLLNALKLDAGSSLANTTLGMVKLHQRQFADATKYLEAAIKEDQHNHLAYYWYARLLSRKASDEFGYVNKFPAETASKMRDALKKAIAIDPGFTDSYELLAYVDTVNDEDLDDALSAMQTALKFQPGNQQYSLRIADIYARQRKFADALGIAEKVAKTTDDAELKQRAESMMSSLRQVQEYNDRASAMRAAGRPTSGSSPTLRRGAPEREPSPEEIEKVQKAAELRSVNGLLRKSHDGETRTLGHIQKIDCKARPVAFLIKTPSESFTLTSNDFSSLEVNLFTQMAGSMQVGCDADLSAVDAVITYKPSAGGAASNKRGELVSLEFVSPDFRFLSAAEMEEPAAQTIIVETDDATRPPPIVISQTTAPVDLDQTRREMILAAIKNALHKPAAGEKREMGFLDKIECSSKGVFMILRTPTATLRLLNASPQTLPIKLFTPDLEGVQFGCGVKPIEIPAVFVYKDAPDSKAKTAGAIVSLDFVPKSFVLD